jgi:hypothetical protein
MMGQASHPIAGCAPLDRIDLLERRLRGCTTVGALFAKASDIARGELGFSRAMVVSVESGHLLTADHTDSLTDPESDVLRRRLLQSPVLIASGSQEAALLSSTEDEPAVCAALPSALAASLDLQQHALGVVMPDARPLALLVLDRAERPVEQHDLSRVAAFAVMVSRALELTVLRQRLSELSASVRALTVSLQAVAAELSEAPTALDWARGESAASLFSNCIEQSPRERPTGLLTSHGAAFNQTRKAL